ncbi:site-specific integrase [Paraburkholderia fungorum]|jgi:integrase|nr:site-specific integrase [Paraburkholderia fungorum]
MCTGLLRRGSRYYIRRRVPLDLVRIVGKSEIVRALGTSDPTEARRLCRIESVKFDQEWQALRDAPVSPRPAGWDIAARSREEAEEHEYYFRHVKDEGVEEAEAEAFEDAVQRTAAVLREAHKLAGIPQPVKQSRAMRHDVTPKLLLPDLCDSWEREKAPAPRSARFVRLVIGRFREACGPLPVQSIIRAHVLAFRDWLTAQGQSPVNTNKQLTGLGTLLNFATAAGTIEANPVKGVKVTAKRTAAATRQPFEAHHLRVFFAAAGRNRSSAVDGRLPAAAKYWLPWLQLFTGARVEELAQLAPSDVTEVTFTDSTGKDRTSPVLRITDAGEGQGVKTAGSVRTVPLHPELIRRGFVAFARSRDGHPRLFGLKPAPDGHESTGYVKWLSRFLRQVVGITDKRLTGHSFRHGFAAACRACRLPENETAALMGHVGGSVHRRYGGAYPLAPLVETMEQVRFAGFDPTAYP